MAKTPSRCPQKCHELCQILQQRTKVMLFILGCGIYCLVKTRWADVAILFGMEAVIGLLMFGGLWIYCNAMDLCDSLIAFLHS